MLLLLLFLLLLLLVSSSANNVGFDYVREIERERERETPPTTIIYQLNSLRGTFVSVSACVCVMEFL